MLVGGGSELFFSLRLFTHAHTLDQWSRDMKSEEDNPQSHSHI